MFDDIKRAIIEPAKAPNCYDEKQGNFGAWCFQNQQGCGTDADEQKQHTFEFDEKWTGEIFHEKAFAVCSQQYAGSKFKHGRVSIREQINIHLKQCER
jgi:hypothetical protein